MQKHRDVLLELAQSNKSDLERALQKICSVSAATLEVARVSYWSVQEDDSAISCEVLYLRNTDSFDLQFKGRRLVFAEYPAYFDELVPTRSCRTRPRAAWQKNTSRRLAFLPSSTRRSGNAAKVSACFVTNMLALLETGRQRKLTLFRRWRR